MQAVFLEQFLAQVQEKGLEQFLVVVKAQFPV